MLIWQSFSSEIVNFIYIRKTSNRWSSSLTPKQIGLTEFSNRSYAISRLCFDFGPKDTSAILNVNFSNLLQFKY